jgi:hypothetical protein
MTGHHDVHVYPTADGRWGVGQGGRLLSSHLTQAAAIKAGRQRARVEHVELIVHGREGRVREKDSYGRESDRADTER